MTDATISRMAGRPVVGRPVKYVIPDAMRAAIAAVRRPRESEAGTVRRLLSVALDPRLPGLLDRAAEAGDPVALALGDRLAPAPASAADALSAELLAHARTIAAVRTTEDMRAYLADQPDARAFADDPADVRAEFIEHIRAVLQAIIRRYY